MQALIVFAAVIAAASAGLIGAPLLAPGPVAYAAHPYATPFGYAAPALHAPVVAKAAFGAPLLHPGVGYAHPAIGYAAHPAFAAPAIIG